jgi:hypothetical protein
MSDRRDQPGSGVIEPGTVVWVRALVMQDWGSEIEIRIDATRTTQRVWARRDDVEPTIVENSSITTG